MACPHFKISVRSRSGGDSAVAGSAYMSGENLYSEYDQRMRYYHYKAAEVMAKDVLLPPNASESYADRQTLWNAVERVEKQWNSQLSRDIIIALPNEIPADQHEQLVREFCQEQFVSKGMIADYAIHDKHDGNPHVHIMLTIRPLDEKGNWLPKSRKVYDLDENGDRIRLPSGNWKSHKENTVDWNDQDKAELWRSSWADLVNSKLEKLDCSERIDLRSYERQGKEIVPTVHLGPAVAHMEAKGLRTEIGDYNREIIAHNRKVLNLKKLIMEIGQRIRDAIEKMKQLRARKPEKPEPLLSDYVVKYNTIRKQGRSEWSHAAREKASVNDVKLLGSVIAWMTHHKVGTLTEFRDFIGKYQAQFDRLKEIGKENHRLETALKHLENHDKLLPIVQQSKKGFASTQKKYAEEHQEELDSFRKSLRYMRANNLTPDDMKRLKNEKEELAAERERINAELISEDIDPAVVRKIIDCVETVQKSDAEKAEIKPEKAEAETLRKPEKKESIHELLRKAHSESTARDAERSRKKPEQNIGER